MHQFTYTLRSALYYNTSNFTTEDFLGRKLLTSFNRSTFNEEELWERYKFEKDTINQEVWDKQLVKQKNVKTSEG